MRSATAAATALASLLALAAMGEGAAAKSRTTVIVTVDVESNEAYPLPEQIRAVCDDGSPCSLLALAGLLQQRGIAGTFFLNVYEHRSWGETLVRDLASDLQLAGQEVALHTHPHWAYDPARTGMWQYTLDEQVSIVRDGVERLSLWTGRPVVAHRAGDYAADAITLEALRRNGLRVDSSLFYGNPRSRLNGLGLPRNVPSSQGALLEVPVTVYLREERPSGFGDLLPPITSIRKVDADWFVDEAEARAAVDAVVDAGIPFLVVFLHSSSLLGAKGRAGPPEADRRTQAILQAILDRVAERALPAVPMGSLAGTAATAPDSAAGDVLPRVGARVSLPRYLWHGLRGSHAGPQVWGVFVVALAGGGAAFAATVRRRKRLRGAAR